MRHRSPFSAQNHTRCGFLLAVLTVMSGCSKPDPSKLKEWSPEDHGNATQPSAGQVDAKKRAGMPDLEQHGISDVVLATWKQKCITCHGVIGRGDGPQGAALKPPNLTNPKWQKNAIDSEIAFTIKNGRGRMPSFSHLPDETVKGLIRLIRLLNSNRSMNGPHAAPAGGAAARAPEVAGKNAPSSPHRNLTANEMPPSENAGAPKAAE